MSWDVDEKEFYETFSEIQENEGTKRALEWAWSALDWTQQELQKEAAKSQSILAEERAAVVAWLRGEPERLVECNGHRHADGLPCWVMSPMPAPELADAIERGEHRRGEEK